MLSERMVLDDIMGEARSVGNEKIERTQRILLRRDTHHPALRWRFSKDGEVHEAMTYFTMYNYNFCWPVRTLRMEVGEGEDQQWTPAVAAGRTDPIWTIREWAAFPAVGREIVVCKSTSLIGHP